jgi:hypothetical protein
MSPTMSKPLYSSRNSLLFLILYIPCSTTGPYILLNAFLSHILSLGPSSLLGILFSRTPNLCLFSKVCDQFHTHTNQQVKSQFTYDGQTKS